MTDSYAVFASPNFDANEYAHAILAGESTSQSKHARPTAENELTKEDISVAISKLSVGIEDVSKQLKIAVTAHHEALLVQVAGVGALEEALRAVRAGLDEVSASKDKLRQKIHDPCLALEVYTTRLVRLQRAADALRRTARFVVIARRLESQMAEVQQAASISEGGNVGGKPVVNGNSNTSTSGGRGLATADDALEGDKERAIAKAALSIAELVALLDTSVITTADGNADEEPDESNLMPIPLRSIHAVASHIPAIDAARAKITEEMESMVLTGLATLNRSLLASSLQTAHNLNVLPTLVQSLVADLTDAVEQRIRVAFDVNRISKDLAAKESASVAQGLLYRSRVRTEPTNVTAPQWTAALWTRLESLVEEMAGCCIKVYTLERVLQQKRDAVSQTNFMDEAMKVLENKPSAAFWVVLAQALERHSKEAARASSFLQQTLSKDYPRLLRLFHDLFAKIAVHTDTVYTQNKQSTETVLILRALSNFEALYLQRSANRLNEIAAQALSGGARAPPGLAEGVNVARTAINELDAAKFDPLLVESVARNVKSALDAFGSRLDALVVRDRWATNLLGPVSTPQQATNAQLATCLYHCWTRLSKLDSEFPDGVVAIVSPAVNSIRQAYDKIVDPLLLAIQRELSANVARLHKVDLASDTSSFGGAPSVYMKDLAEKLTFIKGEVLAKFSIGDAAYDWMKTIARQLLRNFVLHASIARPLGENGKLQLTSDMTELEFAVSAFLAGSGAQSKQGASLDVLGDDYKALRAMRPLLFLENSRLASREATIGLSPLIVIHHIIVRSPIPLPHALHGWSEAGYVRWICEHSEEEALTLVKGVLIHWQAIPDRPEADVKASQEYVDLAQAVLSSHSV